MVDLAFWIGALIVGSVLVGSLAGAICWAVNWDNNHFHPHAPHGE